MLKPFSSQSYARCIKLIVTVVKEFRLVGIGRQCEQDCGRTTLYHALSKSLLVCFGGVEYLSSRKRRVKGCLGQRGHHMQRFGGKCRAHKRDREGASIKIGEKSGERGVLESKERERDFSWPVWFWCVVLKIACIEIDLMAESKAFLNKRKYIKYNLLPWLCFEL